MKKEVKKERSSFERKRKLIGLVISDKNDKTIKIEIEKWLYHPMYNKRIKLKKRLLANDEKNEAKVGDKVQVIESRPLSKLKRWQLIKIIEKAK